MISILILGIICIIVGIYGILKGKMPLIKKSDIKDPKMYARINGIAGIVLGVFFICYYLIQFDPVLLFVGLFVIYGGSFLAEILTKSI